MATITKEFLSGTPGTGRPIKVAATSTPGTTLHTGHATAKDEVNIWLTNTDTVARLVTVEFGGVSAPDDHIKVTVPAGESVLAVPGVPISGGLLVKAYAAAANVITAWGYVNRIS